MVRRRKECDGHVGGRVQYHCARLQVVATDMLASVLLTRELCAPGCGSEDP
jgi:hypothetical protein